jgi:hypothetical protein
VEGVVDEAGPAEAMANSRVGPDRGLGGARFRVGLAALRADEQIPFRYGAEDMVAAPAGSLLYVLAETSRNSMAVIPVDADSGHEEKAIPVPADSQAMAISPDGRTLYVGTKGESLVAIDIPTGIQRAPIPLP